MVYSRNGRATEGQDLRTEYIPCLNHQVTSKLTCKGDLERSTKNTGTTGEMVNL